MKHCVQCNKVPAKRVEVQFKGDGIRTTFCTDKCLTAYREVEKLEVIEVIWDVNEGNVAFMRPNFDDEPLRCPASRVDGSGIRHRCSKEKSHEKEHMFLCGQASPIQNVSCVLEHGHDGYHQNDLTSWSEQAILSTWELERNEQLNAAADKREQADTTRAYSHYFKDVSKFDSIDVYRVLDLWGVTDPCIQHALKKLLCAGQRGAKDMVKDIKEVIASCERWLEMQQENADEQTN